MKTAGLVVAALLIAYLSMSLWMPRAWYRALLYPQGKPNALARRLNALSDWLSAIGLAPSLLVSLETIGRTSGKKSRVPLVVAQLGGEHYLVSMLGPDAHWVANLKASHGVALLRHGHTQSVRLQEVPVEQRAPILQAYLRRAPGARPHFDINYNDPLEEFERVADRYPVWHIASTAQDNRPDTG